MDDQRLEIIAKIFKETNEIEVIIPFGFNQSNIYGKIRLTVEEEQLIFDVNIPIEYPFVNGGYSTIFSCCDEIKGFLHQVKGNKICIVSPKTGVLAEKLTLEINALKEWMLKYYINEEEDSHYEYLQHRNYDTDIRTQLLFTSIEDTFQKYGFGFFEYADLVNRANWRLSNRLYQVQLVQSFAGKKCHWANRFHNTQNNKIGLWFYIEEEPVITPGVIVENWKGLAKFFNSKQLIFLEKELKNERFDSQSMLFILIGYNISNTENQNVHWQLAKIQVSNSPVRRKIKNKKKREIMKYPIHWSRTKNCSYDRFFGRGKFSNYFTDQKILIIGIGAIGSSLAMSLARGGAKYICLSDFDIVETGNICRSEFLFFQEGEYKVIALTNLLNGISPFINVENFPTLPIGIPKIRPKQEDAFKRLEENLLKYDVIFDCSTDMEIAYMLDKMNLSALIMNLSITNGAKELAVVMGEDIAGDKARIFSDLDTDEDLIYEGQGCAFPTFRASYIDINALVNFGLMNLDYRVNKSNFDSFVIKTNQEFSKIQFEVDEY